LVAAFGVLSLIHPQFASERRWFFAAGPVIAVLTLPWTAIARFGYAENSKLVTSVPQFCGRVIQYLIECASVTPLIGVGILGMVGGLGSVVRKRRPDVSPWESVIQRLNRDESGLMILTVVSLICYDLAIAATESTDDLWHIGIRFTTPLLVLVAMSGGVLIVRISRSRIVIWLPLLLIFIFTKMAQLTPWIFWDRKVTTFDGTEVIEGHLPGSFINRYLNTGQQIMFLRDLFGQDPGTLGNICEFLRRNAKPGDVIVTNYDWEPIYFYTHLPQALKIFPDYPIYQTARGKGLPDYVFNVDHVRWVVWRPVWKDYVGYSAEEIEGQIVSGGARATLVARFDETIWENRPEIHLHRFSKDTYFFTSPENLLPAQIFQIDWPEQ
jgi:hypothetical protein